MADPGTHCGPRTSVQPGRLVGLVLVAAMLCACPSARPSTEYRDARELWTDLLREKLDGAAADPRAATVVSLLAKVPADSIDAPFARQLMQEIELARAEAQSVEARRARQIAEAEAALRPPSALPAPPAEPPAPARTEPEAAPTAPPQPSDGMDAGAFRKQFARCFEYHSPALVGGLAGGEVWGLKDLSICRDLHPQFTRSAVLLFDGRVSVRPASELVLKRYRLVDGRLMPADEPAPPPAPAPAGATEASAAGSAPTP